MILLTFRQNNQDYLGVKTGQGILDVAAANRALGASLPADTPQSLFAVGLSALPALQDFTGLALAAEGRAAWLLDEDRLEIGPCVPRPGKIICVGLNYRQHARESNLEIPSVPVLFSKFQNAIAAPGAPVPLPAQFSRFDYEAELAVIIGRRAKYVPEEQALSFVLGYCNANDLTERGLQGKTSQWMLGKSLDHFLPLGPYLVTADEAGDPQNWPVRSWLNGESRQNSNTADMIFPVAQLIHFISQHMTLQPGDLISTGTPEGVIAGMPRPRVWMKPGDTVTVEVGPLGQLSNELVAENMERVAE
jgi:2-keto-4-pentenoate hydratase/2-oxohepta-3-ene-1,7-dioic acid hydratase in catechol pathway